MDSFPGIENCIWDCDCCGTWGKGEKKERLTNTIARKTRDSGLGAEPIVDVDDDHGLGGGGDFRGFRLLRFRFFGCFGS